MTQTSTEIRSKSKTAFQILVSEKVKDMRSNPAVAALESMRVMYSPGEIISDINTLYEGDELPKKLVEGFVQIAASWEWMAQQMNLPVAIVMAEQIGTDETKSEAGANDSTTDHSTLLEETSANQIDGDRLASELISLLMKSPEVVALAFVKVGEKMSQMTPPASATSETTDDTTTDDKSTLSVAHNANDAAEATTNETSTEE